MRETAGRLSAEKTCDKPPTQKPLSLLARVIQAATELGAWILDSFSGNGTIVNNGVMQVTAKYGASGMVSGNAAGSDRFSVRNSGTIQVLNASSALVINANVELFEQLRADGRC